MGKNVNLIILCNGELSQSAPDLEDKNIGSHLVTMTISKTSAGKLHLKVIFLFFKEKLV